MKNPAQFVNEVRSETTKVVWPTRKEAGLTTLMVFIMATLVAIFFFFVDQILAWGVDILLNLNV
ncbi:MAG: preprotein translocase subunit SecE [Pseudomonadota bacterium]